MSYNTKIGLGFLSFLLFQNVYAVEAALNFSDQQRVSFLKKSIQMKCALDDKKLVELSKIKEVDKCLVEDKSDEDKSLSIKVSCKKDEVMNLLYNTIAQECQRVRDQNRTQHQQNQVRQQSQQQQNRPSSGGGSSGSGSGSSSSTGSSGGGGSSGGSASGTRSTVNGTESILMNKDVETRWCKPIGPLHACFFDSSNFDEPKASCGPANAGEVVMFGSEKLICGANLKEFSDILDAEKKLAKADPKSIKSIVPIPKRKYAWALIKTAPVADCAMNPAPTEGCDKASLGKIIDNCGVVYKCARVDGLKRGLNGFSSNAILADTAEADAALDVRLQQEQDAAVRAGGQK